MALKDIKIFTLDNGESVNFITPENTNLQPTQGKNNLIQRIVKNLKTKAGSNNFSKFGTNLESLFGQFTSLDEEYIRSFLSSYLRDYKAFHKKQDEEIITSGIVLENNELLEDIFIENIVYDYDLNGWIITITVINKSDQAFSISI